MFGKVTCNINLKSLPALFIYHSHNLLFTLRTKQSHSFVTCFSRLLLKNEIQKMNEIFTSAGEVGNLE